MNLNSNGPSAQLYRWFYTTDRMPQNLCPYFWKLVIAYVFAAPIFLIALPTRFIRADIDTSGERFGLGLIFWAILFLSICGIFTGLTIFFVAFTKGSFLYHIQMIGAFVLFFAGIISTIFGAIHLIKRAKEKREDRHRKYVWINGDYVENPNYVGPAVKRPNLIVEFVKAKYNKYCPKIDWE